MRRTRLVWATPLVGLVVLWGCDNKLEKLKAKAEEVNRELGEIDRKWQRWREIVDKLAKEEGQKPRPAAAIQEKKAGAEQVRASIREEEKKVNEKVDEIIKEIKRLSETEISEVVDWALRALPKVVDLVKSKDEKVKKLADKVANQSIKGKLTAMNDVMDKAEDVMARLVLARGRERRSLLEELDLLLVEGARVTFFEEEDALAELARLVDIKTLPIVPNSFVPKSTIFIDQFPDDAPFAELSDGVLAPGTEIDVFLPPQTVLAAPATFQSEFSMAVSGNVAGSGHIHAEILAGSGRAITVQFNGIQIGNLPCGVPVESSLAVTPGKIRRLTFVPIC